MTSIIKLTIRKSREQKSKMAGTSFVKRNISKNSKHLILVEHNQSYPTGNYTFIRKQWIVLSVSFITEVILSILTYSFEILNSI